MELIDKIADTEKALMEDIEQQFRIETLLLDYGDNPSLFKATAVIGNNAVAVGRGVTKAEALSRLITALSMLNK